ncbi:MAG: hypothetical protein A2X36_13955 [Elusimicrobia bacterium GWA2_69_24]|nr:MAG: hypothetical protein A2X36_13955 [Elusimicrobia bacterium GWA2_69_24]HBL16695.1 hypothetical protein [Elusimicrobiota bacterium]
MVSRWTTVLLSSAVLGSACSAPVFRYTPNPPSVNRPEVQAPVFFRGFSDRTTDKSAPGLRAHNFYNLARTGSAAFGLPRLDPSALGEFFVDELRRSGRFTSVRRLYPREEPDGPGILVTGAVERAFMDFGAEERTPTETLSLVFALQAADAPASGGAALFSERYEHSYGPAPSPVGGPKERAMIERSVREAFGLMADDLAKRLPTR